MSDVLELRPGQWVHVLGKVEEDLTAAGNVAVGFWTKAGQYLAEVEVPRDYVVAVVPPPLRPEPDEDSVVLVEGVAWQRMRDGWYCAGGVDPLSWERLCAVGVPRVVA